MFRTVVVPLDGSELAERALPYAVKLAATTNGEVVLARVALAPPPSRLDGADWEEQQQDAVGEAEAYLARVAENINAPVTVKTCVPYGRAAHELLDVVRYYAADAVVMAARGRTGLAHLLYGSVAEALLAESPIPVFVVHARPGEAQAAPFNLSDARVMVPLDGSTFAEVAVDAAADLLGSKGELVLVSVVEPPDHVERDEHGRVLAYLDQQEEARTREAREYLARVANTLTRKQPGLRVQTDVRLGEPHRGIVMAAVDRGADLVVMATHGRTGLRRAVVGSVAGSVLHAIPTPVLLVGPREAHRTADLVSAHGERA